MRFWIHILLVLAWLLPSGQVQAQSSTLDGWSPQQADDLIIALRGWVDQQGWRATSEYQRQVALAAAEALRRFPRAAQTAAWQWEQAYSLNLAGDIQACGMYAGLFQQALSTQGVVPEGLSDWFAEQEPRLALNSTPFEAQTGLRGATLLALSGEDLASLFFISLAQPNGSYRVRPLCEGRLLGRGFSGNAEWQLADLTGDRRAELILVEFDARGSRYDINAYNLAGQSPVWLEVPVPAKLITGSWMLHPPKSGQPRPFIDLKGTLALRGGCQAEVNELYTWNGQQMQTVKSQVGLDTLKGDAMCAQDLFNLSLDRLAGGVFSAADTAHSLIDTWPAACTRWQLAHPFSLAGCPADVRDEARFRVALSIAQAGNVNLARQEMEAIAQQPAVPGSTWVQPAEAFARAFNAPAALSRACQAAGRCYPYLNLNRLLRQTSVAFRPQLFQTVQSYGVPVLSSGMVDVDHNRLEEHWFTTSTRSSACGEHCPPELWLVVQSNRRFWSYNLGPVKPGAAITFQALAPVDGRPVFAVPGHLSQPLLFERDWATGRVEILPVCEAFQTQLDTAERVLLGTSPQVANRILSAWSAADLSACPAQQLLAELPRLKYLRALSFELLGDSPRAAAGYQALVDGVPGSLFAYLAEMRLGQ